MECLTARWKKLLRFVYFPNHTLPVKLAIICTFYDKVESPVLFHGRVEMKMTRSNDKRRRSRSQSVHWVAPPGKLAARVKDGGVGVSLTTQALQRLLPPISPSPLRSPAVSE